MPIFPNLLIYNLMINKYTLYHIYTIILFNMLSDILFKLYHIISI